MPWLKVYRWEQNMWPEFRGIELDRGQAKSILEQFAKSFKAPVPSIMGGKRHGNGQYLLNQMAIKVHISSIHLSVLCHEFAHHLAWLRYRDSRHRKVFKRCLKKVYTSAKRYLPDGQH